MTEATRTRRVATYTRVSSDDQAERGTIQTQAHEIQRRLEREPDAVIVDDYVDDGVSGTVPLAERPAGGRLMRDAAAGRFDEVWVYKLDRLGRDLIDLAIARRSFDASGIRLISALEGEPDAFMFDIQSAVAANERRVFLRRSADGMARAARDGRYCGGIVPYGYRVEGTRESGRLVADDAPVWGGQSAADIVGWIYARLGLDGWSCRRIAHDLNARGVPTHYGRDGRLVRRGIRQQRTQGVWRAGRVGNLVTNPTYRGELRYGRRTAHQREVISAPVEALVAPALWHAAQETLARNRTIAKNTRRRYLLKSVMRCGICGLTYCGSQGRDAVGWYRCTGQLIERGPLPGRCWSQSVRTDAIEPTVWSDIERWLRDPGDILDALDGRAEREAQGALVVAESVTLTRALEALASQRKQAIALNIRGRLANGELDEELDRITAETTELERRVAALEPPGAADVPEAAHDLVAEIRARLDAGLTDEQRQEITRLLVRVVVRTETDESGKKRASAAIEYRFPRAIPGVVETRTGTGSWPRPAGTAPGRRLPGRLARWRSGRPPADRGAPPGWRGRTPAARQGTRRRR